MVRDQIIVMVVADPRAASMAVRDSDQHCTIAASTVGVENCARAVLLEMAYKPANECASGQITVFHAALAAELTKL